MKSMTKLMVVAMLLVAALVVAPAAARTYVGDDPKDGIGNFTIDKGDTVYVGEQHLSFAAEWNVNVPDIQTKGARLVHYTDTTKGTYDKVVTISSPKDFELTSSDFGTTTGTYHVLPITVSISNEVPPGTPTLYVDIPKVTLDAVLQKSQIDSVNGKTVTRDNTLAFKLQNNLGGFSGVINGTGLPSPDNYLAQPKLKIDVTLPGGGVTTKFGTQLLTNLPANGTTWYVEDIKLKGEKAGKYTAVAKWPSKGPGASFYGKGYDSNTVTFEILTKKLAISADKDSVVRGKSFSVTIAGESKEKYFLFVKGAGLKERDEYPLIRPNQNGVSNTTKSLYDENVKDGLLDNVTGIFTTGTVLGYDDTQAWVETNAAGTRTVQFDTSVKTDDRQYTIRIQDLMDKNNYDDVKVKVEKGSVTITASGTGVYYIGEEITLSGTNTESDEVYLFLTGPNLGTNGVRIDEVATKVKDLDKTTFREETVEVDDTWSFKWNTAELGRTLDAGGYTVYAASEPQGKNNLSNVEYATASVQLKPAYLTATSSGAKIAKGDDLKITGTAQGDPDNVRVWIFGKNYYGKADVLYDTATVESDGSFEYELKGAETKDLSAGQYFAVIQHPMTNGFGVETAHDDTGSWIYGTKGGITNATLTNLQASDAATALINALDSPNIDDTYVKLTFDVEEAYIAIDPIGDKEAGSKFTISGTTNVAVGDKLIIDVTSAAFGPSKKTEASGFGSVAGSVTVEKGDGANKWSFEVDAADLKPDQYIVKVECIETDTTTTANFNLIEKVETTPTAEVTTTAPVGEVTTTAPAGETTTEPTPTPGFGALVALAGLGAVAFLVLRRK